jgi:hypothetical protein
MSLAPILSRFSSKTLLWWSCLRKKTISHNEHVLVYNALLSVNKLEKFFMYQHDLAKGMFSFLLLVHELIIIGLHSSGWVWGVNKPMKSKTTSDLIPQKQWGVNALSWTTHKANI